MTVRTMKPQVIPPFPEDWSPQTLAGQADKSGRITELSRIKALIGRSAIWFRENNEEELSKKCRRLLTELSWGYVTLSVAYSEADHYWELLEEENPLLAQEIRDACKKFRAARGLRSDACIGKCCYEKEAALASK